MSHTNVLIETIHSTVANPLAEQLNLAPDNDFDILPDHLTNGERVRAEFNLLWDIYSGRRDVVSTPYGRNLYVDEVVGTRYFDNRAIEEVYWRTSTFSPDLKRRIEEIYIHITEDGKQYEIYVDELGHTRVLKRLDGVSKWEPADSEESADCLGEFFHRTAIAAHVHSRRSPEEQMVANDDARELLHERFPTLGLTTTYEE